MIPYVAMYPQVLGCILESIEAQVRWARRLPHGVRLPAPARRVELRPRSLLGGAQGSFVANTAVREFRGVEFLGSERSKDPETPAKSL